MITIWMVHDQQEWALEKTPSKARAEAIHTLCRLHLGTIYPGCELRASQNIKDFGRLEMHPEKHSLINRLVSMEFLLPPSEDLIECSYSRLES